MKLIAIILIMLTYGCISAIKYPDGGYEYPINVSAIDTNQYYYPIKNIESKKYAFGDYYSYLTYKRFGEQNISIKPLGYDMFRLYYSDAFGDQKLIVLKNGILIVKEGNTEGLYEDGTNQMDSIEQLHLKILNREFPIEEIEKSSKYKNYYDSMANVFPQLLDPTYYHRIFEKSFIKTAKAFTYRTSKIVLSKAQYGSLINEINESGYWTLPHDVECDHHDIADGYTFVLEANTMHKYQFVRVYACPNNVTKFTLACQKIIHMAKLDNDINLLWQEPVDSTN